MGYAFATGLGGVGFFAIFLFAFQVVRHERAVRRARRLMVLRPTDWTERTLADYEQQYVDGSLDLAQLEEATGRYLGLTKYLPKEIVSKSQKGVELAKPTNQQQLFDGVLWSSSSYATHAAPMKPLRTVDLHDGAGNLIKKVPVPE